MGLFSEDGSPVDLSEQDDRVEHSDNRETLLFAVPPIGDWFEVAMERGTSTKQHKFPVKCAWMARVIAWHHVRSELTGLHVKSITADGTTNIREENGWEYKFVFGDDRAPNGKLWRDIYAGCESWLPGHYEIKDLSVFHSGKS